MIHCHVFNRYGNLFPVAYTNESALQQAAEDYPRVIFFHTSDFELGRYADEEVVAHVLNVTEDEYGVTATIRLAKGWTLEDIEEKLKIFFWGGPNDYDFNETPPLKMD